MSGIRKNENKNVLNAYALNTLDRGVLVINTHSFEKRC